MDIYLDTIVKGWTRNGQIHPGDCGETFEDKEYLGKVTRDKSKSERYLQILKYFVKLYFILRLLSRVSYTQTTKYKKC